MDCDVPVKYSLIEITRTVLRKQIQDTRRLMKNLIICASILLPFTLGSCSSSGVEAAGEGVGNTVGNAARGVGRTVGTAASGVGNTVSNTASADNAGDAAKAVGKGTASTVVDTGKSHMKTTSGVLKDTGKTIEETNEASKED